MKCDVGTSCPRRHTIAQCYLAEFRLERSPRVPSQALVSQANCSNPGSPRFERERDLLRSRVQSTVKPSRGFIAHKYCVVLTCCCCCSLLARSFVYSWESAALKQLFAARDNHEGGESVLESFRLLLGRLPPRAPPHPPSPFLIARPGPVPPVLSSSLVCKQRASPCVCGGALGVCRRVPRVGTPRGQRIRLANQLVSFRRHVNVVGHRRACVEEHQGTYITQKRHFAPCKFAFKCPVFAFPTAPAGSGATYTHGCVMLMTVLSP